MKKAFYSSLLMHVIIFVFISITLPEIKTKEIDYISVEIIHEEIKEEKISQKPIEVQKEIKEVKKVEIKALPPKKKPSNIPIKKENIEIAKKENIKPKPPQKKPKIIIPKEEKVEKKIKKPENQNNDDFFDNMLKNLAENELKPIKPVKEIENIVQTKPQKTREEMRSIREFIITSIRSQIKANYSNPPGKKIDNDDKSVKVMIYINPDGTIIKTKIDESDLKKAQNDATYLPFVESVQRALIKLGKFKKLPQEEYNLWKSVKISFTP